MWLTHAGPLHPPALGQGQCVNTYICTTVVCIYCVCVYICMCLIQINMSLYINVSVLANLCQYKVVVLHPSCFRDQTEAGLP